MIALPESPETDATVASVEQVDLIRTGSDYAAPAFEVLGSITELSQAPVTAVMMS